MWRSRDLLRPTARVRRRHSPHGRSGGWCEPTPSRAPRVLILISVVETRTRIICSQRRIACYRAAGSGYRQNAAVYTRSAELRICRLNGRVAVARPGGTLSLVVGWKVEVTVAVNIQVSARPAISPCSPVRNASTLKKIVSSNCLQTRRSRFSDSTMTVTSR